MTKLISSLLGLMIFAAPVTWSLTAFADPEMREGYDVQSPEEIEKARREIEALFSGDDFPRFQSEEARQKVLGNYSYLDPRHEVPAKLLQDAVLFFDANKSKFPNQNYITIVDFAPRSDKYRFFLISMATGAVEKFHTTHGVGSDPRKNGFATIFGNKIGSGKSSLGFARTAEVYDGKFKRAVRLDGLSKSNSNLRARAVVLHGWDEVHEKDVIQGLSWGCVTLDWAVKDVVIDKVKEGSLLVMGFSAAKKGTLH